MFSNWKSDNRAVLDEVVNRALNLPLDISKKVKSDEYCGVFVDGRDREICNI